LSGVSGVTIEIGGDDNITFTDIASEGLA